MNKRNNPELAGQAFSAAELVAVQADDDCVVKAVSARPDEGFPQITVTEQDPRQHGQEIIIGGEPGDGASVLLIWRESAAVAAEWYAQDEELTDTELFLLRDLLTDLDNAGAFTNDPRQISFSPDRYRHQPTSTPYRGVHPPSASR